jgi:hypothetical protein
MTELLEKQQTITLKTSELKGYCLDWAVGSQNQDWEHAELLTNLVCGDYGDGDAYSPSTNYGQGSRLMDEEGISLEIKHDGWRLACIYNLNDEMTCIQVDHDYLVAGMRSYVESKFGKTVDVPMDVYEMAVQASEYQPHQPDEAAPKG